jgi:hypothetical protein
VAESENRIARTGPGWGWGVVVRCRLGRDLMGLRLEEVHLGEGS